MRISALYRACILLSVLLVMAGLTEQARAADWPNFRGPNHNGISSEKLHLAESTAVRPLWQKNIGVGCSSVAIVGGRLYTTSNTGTKEDPNTHEDVVYCLAADTGEEIWRYTYKCGLNFKSNTPGGPFATPAVDGDRVYTFSRKGDVLCLDTKSGRALWHRDVKQELALPPPFQGGFAGSPLVLGEMVILNSGGAGTALDKRTGKVIWVSEKEDAAQATPVAFASDGKELWRYPWDTKYKTNVADPIIVGDRVFISTWYRMGCAMLDISSGQPVLLWQNKEMQNHYSTCILWDGHLYGFDVAKLKCMDFKTGQIKWTLEGGFGRGSLMMADGKLIVLTEKGTLLIGDASPISFKPMLQAEIINGKFFTGPVLCDGRIYVRNLSGDLACAALGGPDIAAKGRQ
jgi:outer membrane protein assembly factor BamB